MGECPDFHAGETVTVRVLFDPPHRAALDGVVTFAWDEHVDVLVGDTVLRMPRAAFDVSIVELGGRCVVDMEDFDQHFPVEGYDPQEEAGAM